MHTDSLAVAALLLGTAALVVASLATFATTVLGDPAAVGTLVVLVIAVIAASVLGVFSDKTPSTPYW